MIGADLIGRLTFPYDYARSDVSVYRHKHSGRQPTYPSFASPTIELESFGYVPFRFATAAERRSLPNATYIHTHILTYLRQLAYKVHIMHPPPTPRGHVLKRSNHASEWTAQFAPDDGIQNMTACVACRV